MANVTDIDGVGDSRAETLAEAGYDSVQEIAAADPAKLAENVPRVSEDKAVEFILQAENMLGDQPSDEEVLGPLSDDSEEDEDSESDSEDVEEEEGEVDEEEDESDESESTDSSGPDTYSVELEATHNTSEIEFVTAVTEARSDYRRQNPTRYDACVDLLEQYQENGLSFELTRLQLDTLHAVLRSRKTDYQGKNQIEERHVVEDLQTQVQEARETYFL